MPRLGKGSRLASRRQFLAASSLAFGAAACRTTAPALGDAAAPATAAPSTAAPATTALSTAAPAAAAPASTTPAGWAAALRSGERLVEMVHTEGEIAQMARAFEGQLALIRSRRALPSFPRSLAPAMTFAPAPTATLLAGGPDRVRLTPSRAGKTPGDDDLAFASIAELGALLAAHKVTASALTELCLDRLDRAGPGLACVVTSTAALAREQARAVDEASRRRGRRGPLDGIPYGLKDLFDTRGIATTFGAEPFRSRVPERDAVVVSRLAAAGAVLCAKLSLGALAYGDRWFGGRTRNPWNLDEGSSGSSAGSAAAVAAGLVPFALGTETLGSIVSPATRCGVVGLRPTFGRVARTGVMPLCWSLDKVGVLTRTVEDAVAVLAGIHGADPGDQASVTRPLSYSPRADLAGLRIGHLPGFGKEGRPHKAVDRAALAALRALGAEVVEVEPVESPVDALLPILLAEAAAAFENLTLDGRDDQLSWQDDEAWPNSFRMARFLSAVDLIQADRLRRRVMDEMAAAMQVYDVLVAPSNAPLLIATNFTGHPSLTVRIGFVERGTRPGFDETEVAGSPRRRVPHSVTFYGRLFEEGGLCAVGAALERRLGVWRERPPT